jgi:hypothetical protein
MIIKLAPTMDCHTTALIPKYGTAKIRKTTLIIPEVNSLKKISLFVKLTNPIIPNK